MTEVEKLENSMHLAVLRREIEEIIPHLELMFHLPYRTQSIVVAMGLLSAAKIAHDAPPDIRDEVLNQFITLIREQYAQTKEQSK